MIVIESDWFCFAGALRRVRTAGDPRVRPPDVRPGSQEAGAGGVREAAEGLQGEVAEGTGHRLYGQAPAHDSPHAVLHRSAQGK